MGEIVLLALIALWLCGAIIWLCRRKKRGGGCSGCTGFCDSCRRRCK